MGDKKKYCIKGDGNDEVAMKIKGYFMDLGSRYVDIHSFMTKMYYYEDSNGYVRCSKYQPEGYELKEL